MVAKSLIFKLFKKKIIKKKFNNTIKYISTSKNDQNVVF